MSLTTIQQMAAKELTVRIISQNDRYAGPWAGTFLLKKEWFYPTTWADMIKLSQEMPIVEAHGSMMPAELGCLFVDILGGNELKGCEAEQGAGAGLIVIVNWDREPDIGKGVLQSIRFMLVNKLRKELGKIGAYGLI
jgi:hypothetical protein